MIVSADGHVLITQRSATMDTHPNLWCLPCGYVDWDESIHQAVIREVWEETGINVDKEEYSMYHVNDNPNNDGLQNITFHFLIRLQQNKKDVELDLSDEVQDAYWLSPIEIENDLHDGKEAAFGHFVRIKRVMKNVVQSVLMINTLDSEASTQFEY